MPHKKIPQESDHGKASWTLIRKSMKNLDGLTNWSSKTVTINPNQNKLGLLLTLLHEAGHTASERSDPEFERFLERQEKNFHVLLAAFNLIPGEDEDG